jgi:hypothetical protein
MAFMGLGSVLVSAETGRAIVACLFDHNGKFDELFSPRHFPSHKFLCDRSGIKGMNDIQPEISHLKCDKDIREGLKLHDTGLGEFLIREFDRRAESLRSVEIPLCQLDCEYQEAHSANCTS